MAALPPSYEAPRGSVTLPAGASLSRPTLAAPGPRMARVARRSGLVSTGDGATLDRPATRSTGALGTTASNVSTRRPRTAAARAEAARRRDAKRARYDLRGALWRVSTLDRCRDCGRVAVAPGGAVALRIGADGGAGFAGVSTCGSVWACPVCAAKIAARRGDELAQVLTWATEQGHTVAMVTLTARHHAGMRLAPLWDAVGGAWRSLLTGRAWQATRDAYGVLGWARAVEVTHGDNGWHPHIHAVLVLRGSVSEDRVARLGEALWARWERALGRRGLTALRAPGLDIRSSAAEVRAGLAAYVVKALAMEATAGHSKQGRRGGRAPFQILADLTRDGLADDAALWAEWEQSSRGRKQLTWSVGLRAMAGLAAEVSDEDVAAEDVGGDDVLILEPAAWRAVRDEQGALLTAADRWGVAGARAWLRARGVPWREPGTTTPGQPPSRG